MLSLFHSTCMRQQDDRFKDTIVERQLEYFSDTYISFFRFVFKSSFTYVPLFALHSWLTIWLLLYQYGFKDRSLYFPGRFSQQVLLFSSSTLFSSNDSLLSRAPIYLTRSEHYSNFSGLCFFDEACKLLIQFLILVLFYNSQSCSLNVGLV